MNSFLSAPVPPKSCGFSTCVVMGRCWTEKSVIKEVPRWLPSASLWFSWAWRGQTQTMLRYHFVQRPYFYNTFHICHKDSLQQLVDIKVLEARQAGGPCHWELCQYGISVYLQGLNLLTCLPTELKEIVSMTTEPSITLSWFKQKQKGLTFMC